MMKKIGSVLTDGLRIGQEFARQIKRIMKMFPDSADTFMSLFAVYVDNVRKDGDKVYLVHSVEINSVLHSTQWYSCKYIFAVYLSVCLSFSLSVCLPFCLST